METCEHCGKPIRTTDEISLREWGSYCDGKLTLDTDPFAVEISDDYTLYWDCEGARYESAMDI